MICNECGKHNAIVYINKIEEDKKNPKNTKNSKIGLCANCAKARGINPIGLEDLSNMFDNLPQQTLDDLNNKMTDMISKLGAEMANELGEGSEDYNNSNPFSGSLNSFIFPLEDNTTDSEGIADSRKADKKSSKDDNGKMKYKHLDVYATNLNELAKKGKLDKVIGREKELERLIQILNRRMKNNAALIGEPGVGKTAIMYALALAIVSKKAPEKLLNKEVYSLDLTALIAGTQFRGQFEARVKGVITDCMEHGNVILAIDEMHSIVGGLEHDNSMNAANILKPALANGSIQIVGATTLKEYRKYIEKDAALERRFQSISVEEPNGLETFNILKGIKKYYEKHHMVTIPDEVLKDAIDLSKKYIHDRFLPDKAIDLIDEASSRAYIDSSKSEQSADQLKLTKKYEKVCEDIQNIEELVASSNIDDHIILEKDANLKTEKCILEERLNNLKNSIKKPILTFDNLAKVVELWTGIPATRLSKSEETKMLELSKNLKGRIIGQDYAVDTLSEAILRRRVNIRNEKKPPSFIFVGPTGVGKTALVKALALELFDKEDSIIRLDMSEYMESHSSAKMIGAPPGYVGYDESGYLTEKVRRNPYSIVLFDEIEKAHPSIYNMLLQILDDGILTDSQGRTVSFKHTVIIMTSNIGTTFKNDGYGFGDKSENVDKLKDKIDNAMKNYFSPEFLNRIDDIVVFNKLSASNCMIIAENMINEYILDLKEKNIQLSYTDNVTKFIVSKGFNDKFGARPLKRSITKYIENMIADKYIKGELLENTNYTLDAKDDAIVLVGNCISCVPTI